VIIRRDGVMIDGNDPDELRKHLDGLNLPPDETAEPELLMPPRPGMPDGPGMPDRLGPGPRFGAPGKSWSFRLRGLMHDHAEVGYPSRLQHSTPRRQALRLPAIEKVGRNASQDFVERPDSGALPG